MAVGQSIITNSGLLAYSDAAVLGGTVTPTKFKFSSTEYALDPMIEDIDGWIEADISAYLIVDNNTVEFMCEVPPDQTLDYCRTAGLYLADGNLFLIARPANPFPPGLHHRFKIQLYHGNAAGLTNFTYLSWYETEQDISALETQAVLGWMALENALNNFRLKRQAFGGK